MEIKGCNRKDCLNLECNRYSLVYGYICNECFNELIKKGIDNTTIKYFMDTPKTTYTINNDYSYLDVIFSDLRNINI